MNDSVALLLAARVALVGDTDEDAVVGYLCDTFNIAFVDARAAVTAAQLLAESSRLQDRTHADGEDHLHTGRATSGPPARTRS